MPCWRRCYGAIYLKKNGWWEYAMNTYSRHYIVDVWGCNAEVLNDVKLLEEVLVDAALKAGAEVREATFHQFLPYGISGVVIISESHLSIHTFPEHGYASIDVFTCGERIDPQIAVDIIIQKLWANRVHSLNLVRGVQGIKIISKT